MGLPPSSPVPISVASLHPVTIAVASTEQSNLGAIMCKKIAISACKASLTWEQGGLALPSLGSGSTSYS